MAEALNWGRDGADWPLREHSRFVSAGHLRWHVQRLPPPPDRRGHRMWLLHGTGAATHTWRHLAPLLAQHHEVIAVDLPGHGFTRGAVDADLTLPGMARALLHLRQVLEAGRESWLDTSGSPTSRREAWIGHSAGAAVALQVMLLDPQAAPEVISLNGALLPWGGPASGLFMPLARALATLPWSVRFFAWSAQRPGTVEALLRDTGSTIDERGVACYTRLAHNEVHVRDVLKMMAQWELEPFARQLPNLRGQVTLISSAEDRTVPPSVSAKAARQIPHARAIALPSWGHLGHEEAPAEWASLILQALEARGGVEPP